MWSFLRASGSKKSTLLNVISGLERPESGEIRYDNEDITVFFDNRLTEFRKKHCFYFSAVLSPAAHGRCQKCKNGCKFSGK